MTFTGPGRVEVVEERLPRPSRHQELLEARRTLVSTGTERTCLERDFAPGTHWDTWVTYPFHPGYSFVGVTTGGARVCAHAPHAQRVLVSKEGAIAVPEGVSDEDAAWFALASIAQLGIAAGDLRSGESVVVVGAGVLGQLVAQLARLAGAGRVIVVARARPRLEAALAHGASDVVAADVGSAREEVLGLTGGEGAATVFDVTGSEPVFAESLKLARRHGTVVLLGDAGHPAEQRLGPELLLNGLRVVGAHFDHAGVADQRRMADEFFAAVRDGKLVVGDLITKRVRPREAEAFYASLAEPDPDRLGVVFDWTSL
ncbi:MAG TPA: zinc-binding dehydrogenase [Solirubrobacterales bacterium]|nr:zinc-binding dehydrogenase [Solirubrobacterales bacterium]